jgi:hypothetical protein
MTSIITDIGNQKLLVASPQEPVKIKSVAVGSGRGAFTSAILNLQQQNWIGDATAPIKNGKALEFSCFIPANVGGWEVAEWGLIDVEGDLIAYGQIPEIINKPIGLMQLTPTFLMQLGDSISADIIVTDEINFRHNGMTGRDAEDAHPISSITNLSTELTDLKNKDTDIQAEIDLNRKSKIINSSYTLTPQDGGSFLIDASSGNIVITLHSAGLSKALSYTFTRTDSTNNTVFIHPAANESFISEGFSGNVARLLSYEVMMFRAISSTSWSGVRSVKEQLTTINNEPWLMVAGAGVSRLLMQSDVKNVLNSTDTLNPLSAAQGKVLNDQAFGISQTPQDLTASRVSGVTYTNTTGRPITVYITTGQNSGGTNIAFYIEGVMVLDILNDADGDQKSWCTAIILQGQKYRADLTGGLSRWVEVR